MRKKWLGLTLGLLLPLLSAEASLGETVTEKVARTGFLTVGTRFDQVPFSYIDDQGQLVGYSVDVVKAIKNEMQKRLGREVTIQVVEALSPKQRMEMLSAGKIDIACDINFTWERDEYFDFSLSYGISGIRLLSKKGSNLGSAESLAGKRIGVVEGSVAEGVIKLLQPQAQIISGISSARVLPI
jgi:polar amino acid transport system substrate-binding protein